MFSNQMGKYCNLFYRKVKKMAQTMINQFKNLNERIQLLRATGDISLQKINRLETCLNRRKQLNQYPLHEDINLLNQLVKSQLKMLAEIRTCEYFISCFEAISIFSPRYIEMCNRLFENLMQQFLHDLEMKRKKRFEQLQRRQRQQKKKEQQQIQLYFNKIINEISIDFTINKQ